MVNGDGPAPANVMIVGEAPGTNEILKGKPFVGEAGMELDRMLAEVGWTRSQIFVTNVVRTQPPGNDFEYFIPKTKKEITPLHSSVFRGFRCRPEVPLGYELLKKEITLVRPNLILALGNVPLWALTGVNSPHEGIGKWRGSELSQTAADLLEWVEDSPPKVIPTYHPAGILRNWAWRGSALEDLRRAVRNVDSRAYWKPAWKFILHPSFSQAVETLNDLIQRCEACPTLLSFDIETRKGHIACAGLAWTRDEAICLPFMSTSSRSGYWSEVEEEEIIRLLRLLLCHRNARVIGQNLLYDSQYTYRHWLFVPKVHFDTMIAHHTSFSGLLKKLDYQASIYCRQYKYWKDDGKNWDPKMGETQLWFYNCEDAVRTFEIAEVLGVRP